MEEELSKYRATIVNLIRFHYENDDKNFKKCSKDIADYFLKIGKDQLGEYLYAQFGDGPTFYV